MTPRENHFTDGEYAIIEKVAFEVGEKVSERILERMAELITNHQTGCPWGQKIQHALWLAAGAGAVLAILLRDGVPALFKAMAKM
jgi:hypothetical protein